MKYIVSLYLDVKLIFVHRGTAFQKCEEPQTNTLGYNQKTDLKMMASLKINKRYQMEWRRVVCEQPDDVNNSYTTPPWT